MCAESDPISPRGISIKEGVFVFFMNDFNKQTFCVHIFRIFQQYFYQTNKKFLPTLYM